MATSAPDRGLRLLALDGGGVRGLSALAILKELMLKVDPNSPPKPCDYFDLIGGTSTGGLIAIMLGRLQLSVTECIEQYTALSDAIFQKKRHRINFRGRTQGRFDTEELEQAIKNIIANSKRDVDERLEDDSDAKCKVFVCAQSNQTGGTVRLRSYRSPRARHLDIKIWEAARATSAATTFFEPIIIGSGESFVDGAIGANNPVDELWNEAQDLWPSDDSFRSSIKCLVSIGTGVPSLSAFNNEVLGIVTMLKKISTETEETAEKFARTNRDLGDTGRYYRFNVDRGLENIGLENTKERGAISAATGRYIENQVVFKQLTACADMLKLEQCKFAFQHADCQSRFEQVKSFTSSEWLFQHEAFLEWSTSQVSSLLTLKGNPATSKSVLIKEAVVQLQAGEAIVLHHFFDRSKEPSSTLLKGPSEEFYCSLLYQLLDTLDPKPWSFVLEWGKSLQERPEVPPWTVSKLQDAIREIILAGAGKNVFRIFIDALDECCDPVTTSHSDVYPRQPLEILHFVSDLLAKASGADIDLKVCISRQHLPYYGAEEPTSQTITVETHIQPSIEALITRELEKVKDIDLRRRLTKRILTRSTREFLWPTVVLQQIIEILPSARTKDILNLVDKLPDSLFKLYERLLCTGEPLQHTRAQLLLQTVLGAMRPMLADEFRHALAVSGDFGNISNGNIEDWEDSDEGFQAGEIFENFIRRESRGLLEIYPSSGPQATVRFIHGSVSKFLCTATALTAFGESSPEELEQRCHVGLLEMCLSALTTSRLRPPDPLKFTSYASENWVYHARSAGPLLHTISKLPYFLTACASSKTRRIIALQIQHLELSSAKEWFLLNNESEDEAEGENENETTLPTFLSTHGCTALLQRHLDYCSTCSPSPLALRNAIICGHTATATLLLHTQSAGDINALLDGETLLYKACYFADLPVVTFLLSKGADPRVRCARRYEYALHAVVELGHESVVREILKGRTVVERAELLGTKRKRDGATVLHAAVRSKQPVTRKMAVLTAILGFVPKGVGLLDVRDGEGESVSEVVCGMVERGVKGAEEVEEELEGFKDDERAFVRKKEVERQRENVVDVGLVTKGVGGMTTSTVEIILPVR